MHDFNGAKLALFIGKELLIYLRDDFEGLIYAGMWDLPGGGREGTESPEECALRELKEEFDLVLPENVLSYKSQQLNHSGEVIYFFVAHCAAEYAKKIKFGSEGQYYKLVEASVFLEEKNALPHLQDQLAKYLSVSDQ